MFSREYWLTARKLFALSEILDRMGNQPSATLRVKIRTISKANAVFDTPRYRFHYSIHNDKGFVKVNRRERPFNEVDGAEYTLDETDEQSFYKALVYCQQNDYNTQELQEYLQGEFGATEAKPVLKQVLEWIAYIGGIAGAIGTGAGLLALKY